MNIRNELNLSKEVVFKESELALLSLFRTNELLLNSGSNIFDKTLTQSQFNILLILKNEPKGMFQKDIIERTVSSKGNISLHMKKLLKLGYIEKSKDVVDRRHDCIKLNDTGAEKLKPYEQKYRQLMESIFSKISNDRLTVLQEILEEIRISCSKS